MQQTTPLEELGWYIDPSKLDNVYHWIVELHSFHIFETADGKPIPLSVDMKKAGVKSIVCEIRFPSRYPFDPPFVRVVRPRFLSFMQGGGGHVTAGGAMCMEVSYVLLSYPLSLLYSRTNLTLTDLPITAPHQHGLERRLVHRISPSASPPRDRLHGPQARSPGAWKSRRLRRRRGGGCVCSCMQDAWVDNPAGIREDEVWRRWWPLAEASRKTIV